VGMLDGRRQNYLLYRENTEEGPFARTLLRTRAAAHARHCRRLRTTAAKRYTAGAHELRKPGLLWWAPVLHDLWDLEGTATWGLRRRAVAEVGLLKACPGHLGHCSCCLLRMCSGRAGGSLPTWRLGPFQGYGTLFYLPAEGAAMGGTTLKRGREKVRLHARTPGLLEAATCSAGRRTVLPPLRFYWLPVPLQNSSAGLLLGTSTCERTRGPEL